LRSILCPQNDACVPHDFNRLDRRLKLIDRENSQSISKDSQFVKAAPGIYMPQQTLRRQNFA
jgi:hypothetical protein